MAFNQQEQEIIKWGLQNGKSKDEVKQAISNFRLGIVPQKTKVEVEKPSMFERVQTSIQEKGAKVQEQIAGEGEFADKSALERGIGATATASSALSSTLYNVLPEGARNTLDKAGEAIGGGINYLADKISENPALQRFANSEAGQDTERVARVLADLGIISGEILGADQGAKLLQKGTDIAKKGLETAGEKLTTGTEQVFTAGEKVLPKSPEIMNKVARLTPKQAQSFKDLAGKSHGEYLTETGNFGTPDKIIANEATKFTQSLNSVDDALAKLPGVYKDGSIADALTELSKKAIAESGDNIKSPYLSRVQELTTKFGKEGLNMSEINEVKRLFERNVKLGYNKLTDATKVKQATNIDSALRKWQVKQAQDLGFSNISELNKQTQLSKFIIDNLGDQVVGKSGLNNVTLTDWIMLSGGDPTAVAGFLTKKFFSSKVVQSKIAEMLNKGDIKGQIKADIKSTPESIKRAVSPQGFEQLPAPTGGAKVQINKAILQPSRKAIEQGTEIVTRAKQTLQPQSKIKSGKAYTKTVPQDETLVKSIQKAKELTEKNGGVTITLRGDIPDKGYAVAPYKYTETKISNYKGVVNESDIDNFIKKFSKELSEDNAHFGAWVDGDTLVFDMSKVYNNIDDAIYTAKTNKQDAIFNLDNFETIYEKDYKKYIDANKINKKNSSTIKEGNIRTAPIKGDKNSSQITNSLSTSIQKAKASGQSFDEWVKGQGEPIYHGTNVKFDAFDKAKLGISTKAKSAEKGFWFVDNKDVAKGYGEYASEKPVRDILDQIKVEERKGNWDKANELTIKAEELSAEYADPIIIEARLNLKNPMVYDAKGKGFLATDKKVNDLIDKAIKDGNDGLIIKNLKDNVYSSDVPATHTIVFDDKSIKTRSQLKAEWDKVKTKK